MLLPVRSLAALAALLALPIFAHAVDDPKAVEFFENKVRPVLGTLRGTLEAERPVVVKIIRKEHETDRSFLARFLDEARIQAQLQHQVPALARGEGARPAQHPVVVRSRVRRYVGMKNENLHDSECSSLNMGVYAAALRAANSGCRFRNDSRIRPIRS